MLKGPPVLDSNGTQSRHVVQLFDSDRSAVEGVAQFVREGLRRDDQILVVTSEERWNAVAMRLSASDPALDDAVRFGRIIVRDVYDTLKKLTVRDKPHRGLFAATVEALVEGQTAFRSRPVR